MSRVITPAPTPPQTITVSSTAGFNAGDLVYFNGSTGDYGTPPPSAAGSSVSVPITGPVPLLGGFVGANSSDVGIYGATNSKYFAATLTNGNIVQVFGDPTNPNSQASFRIVNTAGTVVVATTSVSATFLMAGVFNVVVAALTGGGFVIAWINDTGGTVLRPCYAVYSNTGTVVTAAAQDTGTGVNISNAYAFRVVATPSGGFILAGYNVSSTVYIRGYGATGTAAFAWVTLPAAGILQEFGLAVRSNGDFLVVGNISTTSYAYAIWSSTGTVVVAATTFANVAGIFGTGASDATCLSDGTTFVIAYSITPSAATTAFRFIPTGNVLGSEFYIPVANAYRGNGFYGYTLGISALTGNKFILTNAIAVTNSYAMTYAIFDSTGACLSGTSGTTSTAAVPICIPQAYFAFSGNYVSVLETPSGFISLYYTNRDSAKNYSMQVATVNATTYALVNVTPSNQVAGSASGTPLAYAPSGATPLGAAFTIAAGGYAAAGTFGTVVKNPEIVDTTTTTGIANTTLPDGRVLIAYILNSGAVKVAVYSITGVLTQTLSIDTSSNPSLQNWSNISISALTSGKFVITYANALDTGFTVKLYSSTFTQIGTTYTVSTPAGSNAGFVAGVSGLTGDRYVIAYSGASNYPSFEVYDNTNTRLVGPTLVTAFPYRNVSVCGYSSGGFILTAVNNATSAQQTAQYSNPSGNTFTNITAIASVTGTTTPVYNARPVANTNGVIFSPYTGSSTNMTALASTLSVNTSSGGGQPALSGLTDVNSSAVGVTGTGVPVATAQISGVMRLYNSIDTTVALSATLFQPYVSNPRSQNCMTPSYGNNVGIAYIDVNQKVNYAIVCGSSVPTNVTVLSTSPSTPVAIYPVATSVSPAISNTIFTGVAMQTVPAGGAGLVQVSGTAQLGSTYPAGTTYQAFDHQSQGVPGVKGTITGRAITLQGT